MKFNTVCARQEARKDIARECIYNVTFVLHTGYINENAM